MLSFLFVAVVGQDVGAGVLAGHWGFVWAAHAVGLGTLFGYGVYLALQKPRG